MNMSSQTILSRAPTRCCRLVKNRPPRIAPDGSSDWPNVELHFSPASFTAGPGLAGFFTDGR